MAERIVRQLIDDIDGTEISDGGGERIDFSFRGVDYHIDLSSANALKFEKALRPYIEAAEHNRDGDQPVEAPKRTRRDRSATTVAARGRKAGRGAKRARNGGASAQRQAAIRAWARENGHDVSDRGRIKSEIVEAFDAAH